MRSEYCTWVDLDMVSFSSDIIIVLLACLNQSKLRHQFFFLAGTAMRVPGAAGHNYLSSQCDNLVKESGLDLGDWLL